MKKIALTALALVLMAAWLSVAQASDEQKFDSLIKRYALPVSGIFDKPLSPKAACAASDQTAGFLMVSLDGRFFCALPHFDANGSLSGYDPTFSFTTIAK